jgi:hypothetical protein
MLVIRVSQSQLAITLLLLLLLLPLKMIIETLQTSAASAVVAGSPKCQGWSAVPHARPQAAGHLQRGCRCGRIRTLKKLGRFNAKPTWPTHGADAGRRRCKVRRAAHYQRLLGNCTFEAHVIFECTERRRTNFDIIRQYLAFSCAMNSNHLDGEHTACILHRI